MLQPAILYKEELSKAFNQHLYSDKYLWYTGSIENYEHEIKEEGDKFQYAIVESGQILGYFSFRVDWYCSCIFNFSLVRFLDIYLDNPSQEYKNSQAVMFQAIREMIKIIKSFNMHRIDFRCVSGNPAENGYDGIIKRFQNDYDIRKVEFRDNIKDTHGDYHDTIMYELIKK